MKLTRRDIENYLIDSTGFSLSDFEDYTTGELVQMLRENNELQLCRDYNGK